MYYFIGLFIVYYFVLNKHYFFWKLFDWAQFFGVWLYFKDFEYPKYLETYIKMFQFTLFKDVPSAVDYIFESIGMEYKISSF